VKSRHADWPSEYCCDRRSRASFTAPWWAGCARSARATVTGRDARSSRAGRPTDRRGGRCRPKVEPGGDGRQRTRRRRTSRRTTRLRRQSQAAAVGCGSREHPAWNSVHRSKCPMSSSGHGHRDGITEELLLRPTRRWRGSHASRAGSDSWSQQQCLAARPRARSTPHAAEPTAAALRPPPSTSPGPRTGAST
jgi:hypothetical protein